MKNAVIAVFVVLVLTLVAGKAQSVSTEMTNGAFGQNITYKNEAYIRVTNAEQFLNALGSGRSILVAKDTEINLTPMLNKQSLFRSQFRLWMPDVSDGIANGREAVVSEEVYDGRQLTIVNMKQMTIEGEGNSRLVVEPRYAFCLSFVDCQQCTVKNLTIGHTEEGQCEGGVIGIKRGWRVFLFDCDLYGCGTYGLDIDAARDFSLNSSVIHDCTYGIMLLRNTDSVHLNHCDFFHNREFALIDSRGCNVVFNDCRFFANNGDSKLFNIDREFYLMGCQIYHPTEMLGSIHLADQTGAKNVFNPNPLHPGIQQRALGQDRQKAKQ